MLLYNNSAILIRQSSLTTTSQQNPNLKSLRNFFAAIATSLVSPRLCWTQALSHEKKAHLWWNNQVTRDQVYFAQPAKHNLFLIQTLSNQYWVPSFKYLKHIYIDLCVDKSSPRCLHFKCFPFPDYSGSHPPGCDWLPREEAVTPLQPQGWFTELPGPTG